MKTSTKIFLAAMLLLGIGLVVYDFQLKAALLKADYTRAYYDYDPMAFHDFDRVRLNASTAVNIQLVKGDFKVLAAPRIQDFLRLRQEGDELIVDARFPDHFRSINAEFVLYISCPTLKEFRADARYEFGDESHTDEQWNQWDKTTVISGFHLDSLGIREDNASHVVLRADTISAVSAVIGPGAVLTIGRNAALAGGKVAVANHARLIVYPAELPGLHYQLADSAMVEVSGSAAKQLFKTGQP